DHPLVAVRPDPADVPCVEPGHRIPTPARRDPLLAQRRLLGGLFRNDFLLLGKMGMIIIAHRTDRKATWTVAERADDAQQSLPESEHIARAHHCNKLSAPRAARVGIDHAVEETQDLRKTELLRVFGAPPFVDA